MSIGVEGTASLLSSIATIDFYCGVPPSGFTKGMPEHLRSDKGEGSIPPEVRGTHFFGYKPYHLAVGPPRSSLAKATNISHTGRIALTYLPVFKHTYRSDLKITTLPTHRLKWT